MVERYVIFSIWCVVTCKSSTYSQQCCADTYSLLLGRLMCAGPYAAYGDDVAENAAVCTHVSQV
jgi:hypothetical protein